MLSSDLDIFAIGQTNAKRMRHKKKKPVRILNCLCHVKAPYNGRKDSLSLGNDLREILGQVRAIIRT